MYEYYAPTRILIGNGVSGKLQEALAFLRETYSSVYVAASKTLWENGALGAFRDTLEDLGADVHFNIYSVNGPSVKEVLELYRDMEAVEADIAIGVGGGRLLDAVKLAAAIYASGGVGEAELSRRELELEESIPVILVPTTFSGAETSRLAYIVVPSTGAKLSVESHTLYPRIVLGDPSLSSTLPPRTAAAQIIALLAASIEAYVSLSTTWFARIFAREAVRLVARNLYPLLQGGGTNVMEALHAASTLTGLALSHSSPTLLTAMAMTLNSLYHIPYGEAAAVLLPAWLTVIRGAREQDLGSLAWFAQIGLSSSNLIKWVSAAIYAAQLPRRLRDLGVDMEGLRGMALIVWNDMRGFVENNPVPMGVEDIIEVYKAAY